MAAVRWAKNRDIDALTTDILASYFWPLGLSSNSAKAVEGTLYIKRFSGKITLADVEKEMTKCVRHGFTNHLSVNLPKVYHGVVRRKCMDQVRERTGAFVKGLTPDIYTAFAVSNFIKRLVVIDYPLIISGYCNAAAIFTGRAGRHVGTLSDAPHFNGHTDYHWEELIPRFYSKETIRAEGGMYSIKQMKREDLVEQFSLPMLVAYCICLHPEYWRIIIRDYYRGLRLLNQGIVFGTLRFGYSLMLGPGYKLVQLVLRRFKRSMCGTKYGRVEVKGINNIVVATNTLSQYLKDTGQSFSEITSRSRGV
jgi:hypothetical protein